MADLLPARKNLAQFEVHATALDQPTDRRRWNGDPMASKEAHDALFEGVEAFQAALRARGFTIGNTDFGVIAREPEDG